MSLSAAFNIISSSFAAKICGGVPTSCPTSDTRFTLRLLPTAISGVLVAKSSDAMLSRETHSRVSRQKAMNRKRGER